jgi:hypothetical protein
MIPNLYPELDHGHGMPARQVLIYAVDTAVCEEKD